MAYATFFRTGHRKHCPVQCGGPCHCESFLYVVTGVLSLCTGLIQIGYGYQRSLAITSDALHALVDSSADFYGSFVARENRTAPDQAKPRTRRFNLVAGLLLAIGVFFLWWELLERLFHGYGQVSVVAVSLLGGLGTIVDGFRLWLLTQAGKRFVSTTRLGVLLHVKSDLWHSVSVLLIGLLLLVATTIDRHFLMILPWCDAVGTVIIGILMLSYAKDLMVPKKQDHHDSGHHHHHHSGDHHHK